MKGNTIYREITKSLSGTHASFIPGDFHFLPNRFFIPEGIFQTTCEGKNLNYLGAQTNQITAGSISFDKDDAIISTFGEFVERYCASFQLQQDHNIIENISHKELSKTHNVINFEYLKLYKEEQYDEDFPYIKIAENTPVDWVKGYCHITEQEIYLPCEFVFLPYRYNKNNRNHWNQTSTGLAAHTDKLKAIKGGYLESEERNAFSKWWYLQSQEINKQIKYNQNTILEYYKNDKRIQQLYNNDRVEIITYDLGRYSNVETIVCFTIFTYKEKEFISIGCSSRFDKGEAIIKACMESYQGIDYAILLCAREDWIDGADEDFNLIDGFDKHFAFYNYYPEFRSKIPLYQNLKNEEYSDIKVFDKVKSFDLEEIRTKHKDIQHIISVDLTTEDVRSLGFEVHRVSVPGFHLLTGTYKTPFLGLFKEEELFLNYPHPFP